MSNRTDFDEVAKEIVQMIDFDPNRLDDDPAIAKPLQERIALELHNAFVAGQEAADQADPIELDHEYAERQAVLWMERAKKLRDQPASSPSLSPSAMMKSIVMPILGYVRDVHREQGRPVHVKIELERERFDLLAAERGHVRFDGEQMTTPRAFSFSEHVTIQRGEAHEDPRFWR